MDRKLWLVTVAAFGLAVGVVAPGPVASAGFDWSDVDTSTWTPLERGEPTTGAGRLSAASVEPAQEEEIGAELDYIPIEPCRVVDTRFGGGAFASNETRSFHVAGTSGFGGQGGLSGGCGVPKGTAMAVHMSFTGVGGSGSGFVRAWAYDEPNPPAPNATILNYSPALNATNTATVPICDDLFGACTRDLLVRNAGASVNLIVDVLGYYVEPLWAVVIGTEDFWLGSNRAVDAGRVDTGVYLVDFDRDVWFCSATATHDITVGEISVSRDFSNPERVFVATFDSAGELEDADFNLTVTC